FPLLQYYLTSICFARASHPCFSTYPFQGRRRGKYLPFIIRSTAITHEKLIY
uniref:Uncharacterized protein n=1 Tax=Oreochromis aureus TaxID=47969 RepID=A0AAZ1Y610_OREAU